MHDITSFQRDILYVIKGIKPTKGLAIKDELDEYYPSPINRGHVMIYTGGEYS